MIWVALGCLALGLLLGGAGMRRHLRVAGATWRPAAGLLAVVCLAGAAVLALRESWAGALVLVAVGGWLALGARRRTAARTASAPARTPMSLAEAASVLGVPEDADAETVKAAYVRLMRRAHPDAGGSSGLAAQLNAARERMLRDRRG